MSDTQFVCPRCGGHYWGTSDNGKDPALGHCHDQYGTGCKFRWDRSNDNEYFKPKPDTPQPEARDLVEEVAYYLASNDNCHFPDGKHRNQAREIIALVEPAIRSKVDADAKRYQFLRNADIDSVRKGGIFAGVTPENIVLNGDDLDEAIDETFNKLRSE